jgi:hypothetical protein
MRRNRGHVIGGLLAAVLSACAAAAGLGACADAADDCHNTKTCDPPLCNMDAGVDGSPLDGVDGGGCCLQEDGGVLCVY